MKKALLLYLSIIICSDYLVAQKGRRYHLIGQWDKFKNTQAFLTYHNGISLVVQDTFWIDSSGKSDFISTPSLPGMYSLAIRLHTDRSRAPNNFLVTIILDSDTMIVFHCNAFGGLAFQGSQDNTIFYQVIADLQQYERKQTYWNDKIQSQLQAKKEVPVLYFDSVRFYSNKIRAYKYQFKRQYPKHIFNTIAHFFDLYPLPSKTLQTLEDTIAYRMMLKRYFLEHIDVKDIRCVRIPYVYQTMNTYLNTVIENSSDSLYKYVDTLASILCRHNKTLFKYMAYFWMSNYVYAMPFIGSERLYYNIYNKYIATNHDDPLYSDNVGRRLKQQGQTLMFNQIGMKAGELELMDLKGNVLNVQKDIMADYVLLCFWDPDCSHCKKVIPSLDSLLFKTSILQNAKISFKAIAVSLNDDVASIGNFIKTKQLSQQWLQTYDTKALRQQRSKKNMMDFRLLYGLDQTPKFYLLDRHKVILAQTSNYEQLFNFIIKKLNSSFVYHK